MIVHNIIISSAHNNHLMENRPTIDHHIHHSHNHHDHIHYDHDHHDHKHHDCVHDGQDQVSPELTEEYKIVRSYAFPTIRCHPHNVVIKVIKVIINKIIKIIKAINVIKIIKVMRSLSSLS